MGDYVTRKREMRNVFEILVYVPDAIRPLIRPARKWDSEKMDPKEKGMSGFWIQVAQKLCRAVLNSAMISTSRNDLSPYQELCFVSCLDDRTGVTLLSEP